MSAIKTHKITHGQVQATLKSHMSCWTCFMQLTHARMHTHSLHVRQFGGGGIFHTYKQNGKVQGRRLRTGVHVASVCMSACVNCRKGVQQLMCDFSVAWTWPCVISCVLIALIFWISSETMLELYYCLCDCVTFCQWLHSVFWMSSEGCTWTLLPFVWLRHICQ